MESNNPILVRRAYKEASEREEYGVQHAGTVAEVGKMKKSFLGGLDIENTNSTKNEPPTGIVVTFQSRLVPNLETRVVSDTDAKYWMSWDGQDERWSSKTTRWVDKINATISETGLRNRPQLGAPKSKLLVVTQDLTTNLMESPFESEIINPWLPRALTWISGLLISNVTSDTTYRWWCYDNIEKQTILTRIDSVVVHFNETKTLTTQFGEGMKSANSTFDNSGHLIRQTIQNNAVITGSTKDQLSKIWAPLNL